MRGISDDQPADRWEDAFLSGNGRSGIMVHGDPHAEVVIFTDHAFVYPNGSRGKRAPALADRLERVRDDLLAGNHRAALDRFCAGWTLRWTQPFHPSHRLLIGIPPAGPVTGYRRATDFTTGEVTVGWRDRAGAWARHAFASRADDVVVQRLAAPAGRRLDATFAVRADLDGTPAAVAYDLRVGPAEGAAEGAGRMLLRLRGTYPAGLGAYGYQATTLVVAAGGTLAARADGVEVAGAAGLLLLTRLGRVEAPGWPDPDPVPAALAALPADYDTLLSRHVAIHRSVYQRVTLDLGGDPAGRALPVGPLLARPLAGRPAGGAALDPALLERLFDAGRYLFLSASGRLPPRLTGLWTGTWEAAWSGDFTTDANLNLQVAGCNLGAMPEAMAGYADLVLGQLDDWRANARAVYGARGLLAPPRTDGESGALFHFEPAYPFQAWTAGADWLLYPIWEHYLVTGDQALLRDRLAPALRELALFYEDFLGLGLGLGRTDAAGHVVLAPSYSPENAPASTGVPMAINATMDLAAARHALATAIEACERLGLEGGPGEGVERWRSLLPRLPPYRVNSDGALAEWAWPGLDDRYDHRHVSHLYPVWPLHEINPEDTPELVEAAREALRRRGDENRSGHGTLHRALAWARLKDGPRAGARLRELLGADLFFRSLMSAHYPGRRVYNADVAHGLPALLIELLVHTRPGVVELLPALPDQLGRGALRGVRGLGGITLVELRWNLAAGTGGGTVRAVLRAAADGEVTLISRRGIAAVSAAAPVAPSPVGPHARVLALPAGAAVAVEIGLPGAPGVSP